MGLHSESGLISIVLPTRNRAAYLPGCIDSCLNQTYANLELVIVNDGSTDETANILADYERRDQRVRTYHQYCGSLPAVLNYGFRWTRGEYLTWMCDDDLYEADAMEIMLRELRKREDVGLVYCDFKNIDENGAVLNLERRGDVHEMDYKSVIGRCVLYKREVYAKLGEYSVEDYLNEDDEYWLRVRDHFGIHHIDASPYLYRLHPESLTETRRSDCIVAQHYTWSKRASSSRERKRIMSKGYLMAANTALYRNGKNAAVPYIRNGMKVDPIKTQWIYLLFKLMLPQSILRLLWERNRMKVND
jgi:glycosyltransferase involved in cell wall biosynthesis